MLYLGYSYIVYSHIQLVISGVLINQISISTLVRWKGKNIFKFPIDILFGHARVPKVYHKKSTFQQNEIHLTKDIEPVPRDYSWNNILPDLTRFPTARSPRFLDVFANINNSEDFNMMLFAWVWLVHVEPWVAGQSVCIHYCDSLSVSRP